MKSNLPIDAVLPDLTTSLMNNSGVVLRAPAGAGKTTRVPQALLDAGFGNSGQIVMLEPRRIAARTAARRIASEAGVRLGDLVGYRVRFENVSSPDTRILVVTEGVLLRRLQDDACLEHVSCIIFDEFHERRLDSDLALAMVRRVQQLVRPELKIVVMSATLDPKPVAMFLGDCPVIDSPGRQYSVRVEYLPHADRRPITELATTGVDRALKATDGDILVFLPGVGEIQRTRVLLQAHAERHGFALMTLFGDMPAEEQDRVLAPVSRRKVILSTNVAETSITIDGVTAVVDTGLARQMVFDPDVGLDRLELVPVSRAATDQRAGRAGRTQPGVCFRLWDESSQRRRRETEIPEIRRVDLSASVLQLLVWGEDHPEAFPWFESPPIEAIQNALRLLRMLGAVDDRGVTDTGRLLSRFPVHPRLACLIVNGARNGCLDRAATLAALLSEREPFLRNASAPPSAPPREVQSMVRSRSDVIDRLEAVESAMHEGRMQSRFGEVHRGALQTIVRTARQLRECGNSVMTQPAGSEVSQNLIHEASNDGLARSLLAAFPDRVARRREAVGDRALMVGGRGVRLGPNSAVFDAQFFVCVDVDGAGSEALVRQASAVERDWLESAAVVTTAMFFHPTQKQVVARRRVSYLDLVLEESPSPIEDPAAASQVLFEASRPVMEEVLPDDEGWRNLLARVSCLKAWLPDQELPEINEALLTELLRRQCQGRRSFAELRQSLWTQTLRTLVGFDAMQRVEREAPEQITVPSGNRIRLVYEAGKPPVLPVRIQEVFGWKETPRIACGRVAVLLHLLAPNMRPQQITDDLSSFWTNTYPVVKKELRRRYPKHSWPDDPLNAKAVSKGHSAKE
jgi:ATP-dependent helicase HrpB